MIDLLALQIALLLSIIAYILYQRCFHPLAAFPGPFFATTTNFWRFFHEIKGDLPSAIQTCHKKYGAFVRVAPNEIDTNAAEVVDTVYVKGGRHYPKSDFYDGFTAIRPNIFGTRDEQVHALLRRQMAHAFSQASLTKMEYIFQRHTVALIQKLGQRDKDGADFNLGHVLKFFARDCNGELTLGVQFGTQEADDPARVPPLNGHIALGKMTGYVPWTKKLLASYGRLVPWPYMQELLRARAELRAEAVQTTDLEFKRVGRQEGINAELPEDDEAGRINLLNSLVRARDPDTGLFIDREDVASNALTFLGAGSHSTAASLEIFFWYLCQHQGVQQRCRNEIIEAFGQPRGDDDILPFAGLEIALPYTSAVLKETFRLSPTFQHPLPRTVPPRTDAKWPCVIAGRVIPAGAISAGVYSIHRNEEIWGSDANAFRPERWLEPETRQKERFLMHFGAGHRACIGRNQALFMIWKVQIEALRRFKFCFETNRHPEQSNPALHVCGFAELAEPLMVKISRCR